MKFRCLFLLCALLVMASCSDNDDYAPAYVQELADLTTDSSGASTNITTDNGELLTLTQAVTGLRPDTTYRILANYIRQGSEAQLAGYAKILAPEVGIFSIENVVTDPLSVTSCWQGSDYINLRIRIKSTSDGTHYFGFHETNYIRHADGKRTMCVMLIHDQNNDPLYYSRETYISLPLRPLSSLLTAGRDSLQLTIHTFDGTIVRTFSYQ